MNATRVTKELAPEIDKSKTFVYMRFSFISNSNFGFRLGVA